MSFQDLPKCFNSSIEKSFSRKKFFLVFPVLILCGLFIVFCRALAFGSSTWITMSMVFLPIFLSFGILLSLGVVLIRIYYHEMKQVKFSFNQLIIRSWRVIVGTSYLSVPTILIYLLLWVFLGIFLLLKEIPYFGPVIGVILAFAPFVIILSSIILVFVNIGLLFFISPFIALKAHGKMDFTKEFFSHFKNNVFSYLLFFIVALLPIGIILAILSLTALLTNLHYLVASHVLSITLQWFFIMLPFCAFATPCVIFFFNFAAETYNVFFGKGEIDL